MPFPYEGETGATGPQIAKLRRIHPELIKPVSRKVQDCHQKPGAGRSPRCGWSWDIWREPAQLTHQFVIFSLNIGREKSLLFEESRWRYFGIVTTKTNIFGSESSTLEGRLAVQSLWRPVRWPGGEKCLPLKTWVQFLEPGVECQN